LERQLAVDPLSSYILFGLGMLAYYEQRYDRAREYYERARRFLPEHPGWLMVIAQVMASQGDRDAFRTLIESAPPPETHYLVNVSHILYHAWLGDEETVDRLDTDACREVLWGDLQYSNVLAQAYALLNRRDEALRWLERSVERGNIHYPFLSKGDPLLENLRGDPRFDDLMTRVRGRWETFEADVEAG
jgi:tetratricopeptide (TPR) repeat protein